MMNKNIIEPKIIGHAYTEVKKLVKSYAENNFPVLFIAERGSGKELFAEYYKYYHKSQKENQRTINCAGIAESLLEAELFGYVKGSFTGATKDKLGMISVCDGGVLFLDEIGDASERMQASLLRVMENNGFKRVGDTKETETNITIIAATNKPNFLREDLKDRFHIVYIPPLVKQDIPSISKFLLKSDKPLKHGFCNYLMNFDYPGNVRELLRMCNDLHVEHGKNLFETTKRNNIKEWFFDYKRFKQEFHVWLKYIKPLVLKYNLNDVFYEFLPLSEKELYSFTIDDSAVDKDIVGSLENIIRRLIHKEKQKDDVQNFNRLMQKAIRLKIIPKLLQRMYSCSLFSHDHELDCLLLQQEVNKEMCLNRCVIAYPHDMNSIYDIENYESALSIFENCYFEYNLEKFGNQKKTALALKIDNSKLSRIISKLKKKRKIANMT